MNDKDLYSGITTPEKQAEYEAWLTQWFGAAVQGEIDASRRAMSEFPAAGMAARMTDLKIIEDSLAEALRRGLPPQSRSLDGPLERHRQWVEAAWGRSCSMEAYAGLAKVYGHPDFRKRYETIEPGFADYLVHAMEAWVRRQG